jgi:hypothetical protein
MPTGLILPKIKGNVVRVLDYQGSRRKQPIRYWVARASWIYSLVSAPVIVFVGVSSPYIALDCSYLLAIFMLTLLPLFGMTLSLWGRRGLANRDDNSFMENTKRESGWGMTANGTLLALSLILVLILKGRASDLQENRDSVALGQTNYRIAYVLRGCQNYAQKFNGGWPLSIRVLLEGGFIKPADIAKEANDSAVLERVACGDKAVSNAEIEHATGLRYLGKSSGICAKQGDHRGDFVAVFSLGKSVRGRIAVGWSDGISDEIDLDALDKPLPK